MAVPNSLVLADLGVKVKLLAEEYKRNVDKAKAKTKQLKDEMEKLEKTSKKSETGFRKLAGGVATGTIAAHAAMTAFRALGRVMSQSVVSAAKLAAEYEVIELSFEVMIGNAARARRLVKDFRAFADVTPFRFTDIAATSKQLLAFGIATGKLMDAVRRVGDVASGTGNRLKDLAFVYGQTRAAGRLMTRDLLQFTDRGVPLIDELTNMLDISRDKLRTLTEEGDIPFEIVEQAFKNMTDEGGKFHNMTERLSQTAFGLFTTLKDAIEAALRAFGEGFLGLKGGSGTVKDIFRELIDFFKESEESFRQWGRTASALGETLAKVAKFFGAPIAENSREARIDERMAAILDGPGRGDRFKELRKLAKEQGFEGIRDKIAFEIDKQIELEEQATESARKRDKAISDREAMIEEHNNNLRKERERQEAAEKEIADALEKQAKKDEATRKQGARTLGFLPDQLTSKSSQLFAQLLSARASGEDATFEMKQAASKARARAGFDTRSRDLAAAQTRALEALDKAFAGADRAVDIFDKDQNRKAIISEFEELNRTSKMILDADLQLADEMKGDKKSRIVDVPGFATGRPTRAIAGEGIRRAAEGTSSTFSLLSRANAQRARVVDLLERIERGNSGSPVG